MTNIWIRRPEDCLTAYKGKMIRFHLRKGGVVEGVLIKYEREQYQLISFVNFSSYMIHVIWKNIMYVEVLKGLSLNEPQHVCSFVYKSQN